MMTTTMKPLTTSLRFLFIVCLLVFAAAADIDDDDDENYVTCGSVVKLKHHDTGYYLNSESKNLNAGSGQQIVTFVKDPSTQNTLWWLRPAHHGQGKEVEYPANVPDLSCHLAEPIACGSLIRLTHLSTQKNLHSHGVESVLSQQQEVTAYGTGDGYGDGGDNWKLECSNKSHKYWKKGAAVRLYHVDTAKYLGTAKQLEFNQQTCGMSCPIMNHLEAFCRKSQDSYSILKTEQGIMLSK